MFLGQVRFFIARVRRTKRGRCSPGRSWHHGPHGRPEDSPCGLFWSRGRGASGREPGEERMLVEGRRRPSFAQSLSGITWGIPGRVCSFYPFIFRGEKIWKASPGLEIGLEINLTKIKKAWNCFQAFDFIWCPQRDLNSCCRRERPVSWARLDDGDVSLVGRVGFEPTTLCLKGRYSTS